VRVKERQKMLDSMKNGREKDNAREKRKSDTEKIRESER